MPIVSEVDQRLLRALVGTDDEGMRRLLAELLTLDAREQARAEAGLSASAAPPSASPSAGASSADRRRRCVTPG